MTPITTATNTAGKPIKVGGGQLAITPDGKTVYVLGCAPGLFSCFGTVTPITTATNTPGKPIKVGKFPLAIAVTPNG